MDTPFHFVDKGLKMDQIGPERFICNAILFRIKKGANQSITKKDILRLEKKYGKILPNSTIVFATGWYKNLTKKHYFNNNPGLSIDAARYLASKRINLVGIDSPSVDLGKNSGGYFKLIVLPIKLRGASGSPVRAIAI